MGPHIPLNFFMTRLLFVEKSKVNSLKAKSGQDPVLIVMDNPKILKERAAKSLPAVPFPPAAPESPVPVEGWRGVKVGGWISLGSKKPSLPALHSGAVNDETTSQFGNLKVEDDDTEITEDSVSQTFETKASGSSELPPPLEPATHSEPMKPTQHFPSNTGRTGTNSARSLGVGKKSASIGRKLRPSIKKKNSSKGSSSMLKMKDDPSPSSSGAED